MPRFVKFLQLLVLVLVGGFLGYTMLMKGVVVFQDPFALITIGLTVLLELALFVIYKLIEHD